MQNMLHPGEGTLLHQSSAHVETLTPDQPWLGQRVDGRRRLQLKDMKGDTVHCCTGPQPSQQVVFFVRLM